MNAMNAKCCDLIVRAGEASPVTSKTGVADGAGGVGSSANDDKRTPQFCEKILIEALKCGGDRYGIPVGFRISLSIISTSDCE